MKHIPIVFPISFLVIILVTFFSGAYAVAEGAVSGRQGAIVQQFAYRPGTDSKQQASSADYVWYQSAAVWVCPLH